MNRRRLRDLGVVVGDFPVGPGNAITDVAGVKIGYATLVREEPQVIRTGVTAIWPQSQIWENNVFAGCHAFNGNGEMTGAHWIAEQGLLSTPIVITNTHDVGVARDAVCAYAVARGVCLPWMLPVAAETYDGVLSTAEAFAVKREDVWQALDAAAAGPIREGNVGGGTGMICHGLKGGTGTSSRQVGSREGTWTVGALVQANYGRRERLTIAGVPVGRAPGIAELPDPRRQPEGGSIIAVLATDAPLLPIQCTRLARRATVGLARVGGVGGNGSGDLFLAFSTANQVSRGRRVHPCWMVDPDEMTPLFEAAAEATEEAIVNAMTAAETMVGREGRVAHALPLDRLLEALRAESPAEGGGRR